SKRGASDQIRRVFSCALNARVASSRGTASRGSGDLAGCSGVFRSGCRWGWWQVLSIPPDFAGQSHPSPASRTPRMSSHDEPRAPSDANFPTGAMRVDQPHSKRRGEIHAAPRGPLPAVAAPVAAAVANVSAGVEHTLEQLREHAAQLADRL